MNPDSHGQNVSERDRRVRILNNLMSSRSSRVKTGLKADHTPQSSSQISASLKVFTDIPPDTIARGRRLIEVISTASDTLPSERFLCVTSHNSSVCPANSSSRNHNGTPFPGVGSGHGEYAEVVYQEYPPSTTGNSMTGSERPSPEPLLKKRHPQPYCGGENSGNALEPSIVFRVWIPAVLSRGIPGHAPRACPESFRNSFRKVPAVLGVWRGV